MSETKQLSLRRQRVNANRHSARGMTALSRSVESDGWIGAITVAADGETFDGSARVEVLEGSGAPEPIVVDTDGSRPVVVRRTDIPTADDPRAVKLGLSANRVASLNLDWDPAVLASLSDMDLSGLWTDEELAEVLGEPLIAPGAGGDEFDPTPDDGPTRVQPGDLWQLGEHRLLCGDSTKAEDVARLMDGERATAVVTDPPYGINREGVTNDDPEGLRELFTGCVNVLPVDDAVIAAFQSTRLFPEWLDAVRAAGHRFERMLWMYKPSDMTFPWRGWLLTSEAILISSVGHPVWNEVHPYMHDTYSPTTIGKELPTGVGHHASVKPMEAVADIVQRVSVDGAIVYDPFGGSGTTLIACERKGRRCRLIEIEPKHCDLTLRRFTAETGLEPVLLSAFNEPHKTQDTD